MINLGDNGEHPQSFLDRHASSQRSHLAASKHNREIQTMERLNAKIFIHTFLIVSLKSYFSSLHKTKYCLIWESASSLYSAKKSKGSRGGDEGSGTQVDRGSEEVGETCKGT